MTVHEQLVQRRIERNQAAAKPQGNDMNKDHEYRKPTGLTFEQASEEADKKRLHPAVKYAEPVRIIADHTVDPVREGDTGWDVEVTYY